MIENSKCTNILKLLFLLGNGLKYTKHDLAQKYKVSERTIERYIESLRDAEFDIKFCDGFYSLNKSISYKNHFAELLCLTEEEKELLNHAIHSIDKGNLLKNDLIRKLHTVYDPHDKSVEITNHGASENIQKLTDAIKNKKQVILKNYCSVNSKNTSDRLVEPFEFTKNYVSVWCYEPSSRKSKIFKIVRIDNIAILGENWLFENKHKKSSFTDAFRNNGPNKFDIKIRLSFKARKLLEEEYPDTKTNSKNEIYMQPSDNKTYIYEGWVSSYIGISRFVMGLPGQVEVISPLDLKRYIELKQKKIDKIEIKINN